MIGDRRIVQRSPQPFVDAARALLAEGISPDTRLAMRHGGSPDDALRSTVGVSARLTVSDIVLAISVVILFLSDYPFSEKFTFAVAMPVLAFVAILVLLGVIFGLAWQLALRWLLVTAAIFGALVVVNQVYVKWLER